MTLTPGDAVRCEITKWGDQPHWVYPGVYLGTDDHGDWIGFPEGTYFFRPGAEYVAPYDQVGLIPHADLAERGWMAAFHAAGGPVQVYVDIATPPVWDGSVLRSVDLDLDVVRGANGRVWVDDEDEFAQHRVEYSYPDDARARRLRQLRPRARGRPRRARAVRRLAPALAGASRRTR